MERLLPATDELLHCGIQLVGSTPFLMFGVALFLVGVVRMSQDVTAYACTRQDYHDISGPR